MSFSRLLVLVLGLLLAPLSAKAQDGGTSADSTEASGADKLLVPYLGYSPETQIEGGIVVGYYTPETDAAPSSSIQGVFTYTQEQQIIVQVAPEIYLGSGRWRLIGEALWSKFPNLFFGIGGETTKEQEESFSSRFGALRGSAQRRIRPNLRVGPRLTVRNETRVSVEGECFDPVQNALACRLVPGVGGGWTNGLGVSAVWDGRDNLFFPTRGVFVTLEATGYGPVFGSDYTFGAWSGDASAYASVGALPGRLFGDGPLVLAGNVYLASVVGTAPFQLEATQLGGENRMRGYRQGRLRDDVYWAAQIEARVPLFWRFRGTLFASAGEVAGRLGPDLVQDVELAAGIGGRLRVTDGGVYGRIDVAVSETGTELYLSLGEAF